MTCGARLGTGFSNVSLSTATGYDSVLTTPVIAVEGTKLVVGLLVLNGSGSFTITLTFEVSYDGGMTFKTFGSTTTTAVGPKELSCNSIDAAIGRLKIEVAGTSVWVLASAGLNWTCP